MDVGLVSYSSSSSSDEGNDTVASDLKGLSSTTKRSASEREETTAGSECESEPPKRQKKHNSECLPLPASVQQLYEGDESTRLAKDDPTKHSGRIRSFGHVEGNWATFVYVPFAHDNRLKELISSLFYCLHPLKFEVMEDFHMTLSRTVTIRHHWIDSLMDSLKENLQNLDSCICDISSVKLYTNDEKTRTFLSLEVCAENTNLAKYVQAVNESFKEFRLSSYYEDPSFHLSIGWCLGDVRSNLSTNLLSQMQAIFKKFMTENPDLSVIEVKELECKTGNKIFRFPLCDS